MKSMKATLRRLWHLTRATSIAVSLAVVVALVGGVVSGAVAATPTTTTATALLKGVTNTATAVTTLVNSGTGAALSLEAKSGYPALNLKVPSDNPPLTVNPEAGTATDLSADELDGKDSKAFVSATADGKAPDSELLDGIDSKKFAQVEPDGKVANADKLDGMDSAQFANSSHTHSGVDITSGTVDADRIEDGQGSNLNADQLDGLNSNQFAAASTGTAFAAQKTFRSAGVSLSRGVLTDVLSKDLPAGSYVINAKASFQNWDSDSTAGVGCFLQSGSTLDTVVDFGTTVDLEPFIRLNDQGETVLQGILNNYGGGTIKMICSQDQNGSTPSTEVTVSDAVITAIRVSSIQ
jgi:hypothetical protein